METINCFKAYDGTLFTKEKDCVEYEKKKHKNYVITLYFTGTFCAQVCARSEEEAINAAKDQCFPEEIYWECNDEETEVHLIEDDKSARLNKPERRIEE